jgi:molybdenum cofactor cytidylyltransferase
MQPCILVLAAGQGQRFKAAAGADQNKLLALCTGLDAVVRPVLEQVLYNLQGVAGRRLLVTSASTLPEIATIAEGHGFETLAITGAGMGDSLAAGVNASIDASGWLVVLGDMPFIRPDTYQLTVQSIAGDQIVVPMYQGIQGHPVGFGKRFASALSILDGDRGARRLFEGNSLVRLETQDPGVLLDIDVPGSLR